MDGAGSPAAAVVGRTPQFGGLDPSSFNIAVELFVGGLAERRQTLGKNGAKNQTIVNCFVIIFQNCCINATRVGIVAANGKFADAFLINAAYSKITSTGECGGMSMKRIALITAAAMGVGFAHGAFAADMGVRAAPAYVAPVVVAPTWTGSISGSTVAGVGAIATTAILHSRALSRPSRSRPQTTMPTARCSVARSATTTRPAAGCGASKATSTAPTSRPTRMSSSRSVAARS